MRGLALLVCAAACLDAQSTAIWNGYAHDAQHTGLSTVGAQRLETIKWTTPVDLSPGGLIHYGSPMATAGNTVLVPVRTTASNTYEVNALSGSSGNILYTLATDFTPAPHDWIPSYGAAISQGTRLYYPGAGGTVYYRDQLDSASGPSGQIAFYGNSLYTANQALFDATVMISTPITADAAGNIYFGFDVIGSNPANLTSGLARIGANGVGSWVSASAAAQGDTSIVEVAMNCAPAVSNDGTRVYFGVSEGPVGLNNSNGGYLVSVNSATLAPIARIRLTDPDTGQDAVVLDNSSASPTVGPDGDVYYGVFESVCCINDDRGWLLHYDANLTTVKTPGAFGWDTTASVVPAPLVASYHGTSSYLLFTKYNNYLDIGPGGNGHNKIAVLDPNTPATDPITGATVMNVVISILGPTLDPPGNTTGSVREWCINSGAIDPFSAAAIANSEDGHVYRWDFASNSLLQAVQLTGGAGEAYTPTAIGADGTAYAINEGNLYAVGQAANLTITSSQAGSFTQGQMGARYTLTVTNSGTGVTNGLVTVTDTLPAGLTATGIEGSGWACTQPSGPCTRSDSLAAAASYPPLTLTVNVAGNAPAAVTNTATVSSDGAMNSVNSTSADVTTIAAAAACTLALSAAGASLPSTGTSTPAACPDPTQPACGFTPEIPQSFTVTPSAGCGTWTSVSSNVEFVQVASGGTGSGAGTVGYTAFANTHPSSRSATITVMSGAAAAVFTVTEAGSGDSLAYRQVYALYEQILDRDPDSGGFAFWTGLGMAGLGQMADSFLTSPEAFNRAFSVIAAYQAVIGEPPTFAQFAAAVDAMRGGAQTLGGLFTALGAGPLTAAQMYQNLLARAPSAAETSAFNTNGALATFESVIGYPSSSTPVGAASNEFQSTGGFLTDHSNALYIDLLYFTILGRDPDTAGYGFWLGIANAEGPGLLFQGAAGVAARLQIVGPGTAAQGFVGSPEFQGLFAN